MTHVAHSLAAAGTVALSSTPAEAAPSLFWCWPFVCLLLSIALLPLIPKLSHWWESNAHKLIVSIVLALVVCGYYALRSGGLGGANAVETLLHHAIVGDFVPFMVLLFALYTISGGIRLSGDIPAHPITNAGFLLLGAVLANVIGTTGASMLLIRPVLQINSERRHVVHTIVFFIFLVSNIGGALLPIGDPPLFLGYLRGVPFLWTLRLLPIWITAVAIVLAIYLVIECIAYRRETRLNVIEDEIHKTPLKLEGWFNFLFLGGVILAVALLVPGQPLPGTSWVVPNINLREIILLALSAISFVVTPRSIHNDNEFNFGPIAEVACLFLGIFVTMQVPIAILRAEGAALGVTTPLHFFWATGSLSSFLDNAPTYVVFFELAGAIPAAGVEVLHGVKTATEQIPVLTLMAISAGAVFMGANTYIGNGPNFLVKSIAERSGVRMPSFFGYMVYSGLILIPTFIVISIIFYR